MMERIELGLRMQQWHGSASDPIYAVGSFYYAGQVYPERDIVESALSSMERMLSEFRTMARGKPVLVVRYGRTVDLRTFAGYTRKQLRANIADIREIVGELKLFLARDYDEKAQDAQSDAT